MRDAVVLTSSTGFRYAAIISDMGVNGKIIHQAAVYSIVNNGDVSLLDVLGTLHNEDLDHSKYLAELLQLDSNNGNMVINRKWSWERVVRYEWVEST